MKPVDTTSVRTPAMTRRELAAAAGALLLVGCSDEPAAPSPDVIAQDYDSFFVSVGARMQTVLRSAKTIYLAALVLDDWAGQAMLAAERQAVPDIRNAALWMGLRVERLAGAERHLERIAAALGSWRDSGNNVAGLIVDFHGADAAAPADQARFLTQMRAALPRQAALSATGVALSPADAATTGALRGALSEMLVRTFDDNGPRADLATAADAAVASGIPFRFGLLQGARKPALDAQRRAATFRGDVVFLVNGR